MHHIGKTHETISFYSVLSKDRIFIRAIFTDVDEANKYMEENPDQGLYAEFGPFLLIASMPERMDRAKKV